MYCYLIRYGMRSQGYCLSLVLLSLSASIQPVEAQDEQEPIKRWFLQEAP